MVADAETPAKAPKEKQMRQRPNGIPMHVKLRIRTLYLVHEQAPSVIAAQLKLSPQTVQQLVHNQGWTKERRKLVAAKSNELDARISNETAKVIEAVATECEEIAISGLQKAREAVDREKTDDNYAFAAKDFQSWTGGVRNLVNIARQARGLDSERSAGQGATLNVFVGRFETVSDKAPKNVTSSAASDTPKAIDV